MTGITSKNERPSAAKIMLVSLGLWSREIKLDSSCLKAVRFHRGELDLKFTASGEHYRFYGVPGTVVRDLLKADSIGRFFVTHIRNEFEYERLARRMAPVKVQKQGKAVAA
jgi:hypothetical protein